MKALTREQLQKESDELLLKSAVMEDMEAFSSQFAPSDDLTENLALQILGRAHKKYKVRVWRKRFAAVMCIVFLTITIPVTVNAVKPWIVEYLSALSGDAYFHPPREQDFNWEGINVPTKIPKEFLLSYKSRSKSHILLKFEKGGQFVYFYQGKLTASGILDNEDVELSEPVTVNGHPGIRQQNENMETILWDGDMDSYAMRSNLPYQELLSIAQSVREK